MANKNATNQIYGLREPRQERSRYKVQLMLEAAQRLIEKGGLEALTTNAVAATAGVSIGTLYQFFPHKEAILDTLADREVAAMSADVMTVMQDKAISSSEARIAGVVKAVAGSYGGRHEAHRLVMAHSLTRGGNRLAPLLSAMVDHLASEQQAGPVRRALAPADAFVLAHAFAGVLRAMISQIEAAPSQQQIARALSRLVETYVR